MPDGVRRAGRAGLAADPAGQPVRALGPGSGGVAARRVVARVCRPAAGRLDRARAGRCAVDATGAGALGTLAIFALYPLLPIARLVGTEIAHAVPLTLVAGLGHASMGHMDYGLLAQLLMGSLPGIWLGSHMTRRVAEQWLRPALAVMMAMIGAKLVF